MLFLKNKKFTYLLISLIALILIIISIFIFRNTGLNDVSESSINKSTDYAPSIGNKDAKNKVIEFMDYKCPFCKKFENSVYKNLEKKHILYGDTEIRVVNASVLGDDAVLASRAAHALNIYYPEKYWDFHHKLFKIQPNHENKWITAKLIDSELEKLDIPQNKLKKIKRDYKTKYSKSWELANEDKKLYKKFNNQYVPSVYVNGKFIKDPYSLKNIEKYLK